jgi:hypothetical protein
MSDTAQPLTPFDFVKALTETKDNLLRANAHDDAYVKNYNKCRYIINRALSFHTDTIAACTEVNFRPGMTAQMHYDYLLNTTRAARRRTGKWPKAAPKSEDVSTVAEWYGCSERVATTYIDLHTDEQLQTMRKQLARGGLSRSRA